MALRCNGQARTVASNHPELSKPEPSPLSEQVIEVTRLRRVPRMRRSLRPMCCSEEMEQELLKQCVAEIHWHVCTDLHWCLAQSTITQVSLAVALAHGLTIAVTASAVGAISGGQFNPAVTFGLLVGGKMNFKDSIAYWIAQLAGATIAAYVLLFLFTGQLDPQNGQSLASSIVAKGTPDLAVKGVDAV